MRTKIFLLFNLCLLCILSEAQTNLTNTGILKLSSSADTLYVTAKFSNTSTASFTNNGQLFVLGNVENDEPSMIAGTGTLYLRGSNPQTVTGTEAFKTYNFISNNSAGITLDNNLSVAGVHTFTNGVITTSATPNYLIYGSGSSYTGSSDTRHVNGWVKKIGGTDFIFPVGDGTYQRPVAIESLSGTSEFNAKYNAPTPNTNQVQYPILSVNVYEYWTVNRDSGGSASVHLNWDNTKVTFPGYALSGIAVSFYDGSYWTDQGGTATGDISTTGDITSIPQSSFGNFVIGSKTYPLPLKFLSFTAQRKADFIDLKWVTAEEINTDHFEIEKSENGRLFKSLNKTPSLNRFTEQEYSYKDYSLLKEMVYYRIRCVDKDGKSKLSKVIAVPGNSHLQKNLQVLNPVADKIIIISQVNDKEPTAYVLYNQAGSTILKGWINLKVGMDNTIRLSSKPANGIYFLKLKSANQEIIQKLVIN